MYSYLFIHAKITDQVASIEPKNTETGLKVFRITQTVFIDICRFQPRKNKYLKIIPQIKIQIHVSGTFIDRPRFIILVRDTEEMGLRGYVVASFEGRIQKHWGRGSGVDSKYRPGTARPGVGG